MNTMFNQLNFFAAAAVITTTVLTVLLFDWYAKKKLPPEDGVQAAQKIHDVWFAVLFFAELYGQFTTQKTLDATDAVLITVVNVVFNVLVFFICYGVLKVAGVNKENLYARCEKAFIGLVILSLALTALADYVNVPTSRNVPAVTQQVQAEFVINLNGENIYIDRSSLIRTGNAHEDAAPEFKCVLIDDADIRSNCEFKARGVIVMYIDGVEVGDSVTNPEIEELYTAIAKKFL